MNDDLCMMSAHELRARILDRQVSPVEAVRAVLGRIDRLQPRLNCFITVCHESALAEARRAEEALVRGERVGALHGIPFTAKDLVETRGVRTTFGSLLFENNVPAQDAVAVARLRAAGAILVGKTTTPEFGHKGMTDAPLFGRTGNVWDATRTCGGSSGGAAVAVAAGLAALAVASDGGGSTRIPAACNGLVGFKQSNGVIPHSQAQDAFGNYTFVTPMTRTVMDTALMLEAMAGPHPSDPWSVGIAPQDYAAAALPQGTLRGMRILWTATLGNSQLARDVRTAFERALRLLGELGADLEELTSPLPDMEAIWRVVNHTSWRARFGHLVARNGHRMSPSLVRQVEQAAPWSAADYQQAMFDRTALFRQLQERFERADFLVTPTLSRTALPVDHDVFAPIEIDGQIAGETRRAWYPYTMPFNLTGHPAVSVNCGFASDGLPVGLQIVGRFRGEAALLRVAALHEHATPELNRRPGLCPPAGLA